MAIEDALVLATLLAEFWNEPDGHVEAFYLYEVGVFFVLLFWRFSKYMHRLCHEYHSKINNECRHNWRCLGMKLRKRYAGIVCVTSLLCGHAYSGGTPPPYILEAWAAAFPHPALSVPHA